MHPDYEDIRSRIESPPLWFDEHAVPRYCVFSPRQSASVYVHEIALAEIACQECDHRFQVAFSKVNVRFGTVADSIRAKTLHFGDPPNIRCCNAGHTMNSRPQRVIEYWHVPDVTVANAWKRDPSLEVDLRHDTVGEMQSYRNAPPDFTLIRSSPVAPKPK